MAWNDIGPVSSDDIDIAPSDADRCGPVPALIPGNLQVWATSNPMVSIHPTELPTIEPTGAEHGEGTLELIERRERERAERERLDLVRRDQRRLDRNRLIPLERLRDLSGLSQRGAARRIGVSVTTLRSWEAGRAVPSETELSAVVALYGGDLDDLLGPRQPLESPELPGVLIVGEYTIDTNDIRTRTPDITRCNRLIIKEYLTAVRMARGKADGASQPALRSQDLIDLGRLLDVSDHELDRLLAEEFDLTSASLERASRAMMIAGLMSSSVLTDPTEGWVVDGPTPGSREPAPSTVFATVDNTNHLSALRKPMFSTNTVDDSEVS